MGQEVKVNLLNGTQMAKKKLSGVITLPYSIQYKKKKVAYSATVIALKCYTTRGTYLSCNEVCPMSVWLLYSSKIFSPLLPGPPHGADLPAY